MINLFKKKEKGFWELPACPRKLRDESFLAGH